LATAIAAWRGDDKDKAQRAAIIAAYRTAGKDYAPPFAPFRSLDELGQVLSMNPAMLARLKPHLSLYALDEPAARGDPVVAAARAILSGAAATAEPPWPRVMAIDAVATGLHATCFRRHVVVRIDPGHPPGYRILAWSRLPIDFTKN
jgi:general secretion pathway protein K